MATRKRAAKAAPALETAAGESAAEQLPAGELTPAAHVSTALTQLEALGARRSPAQVNALAYLKQAQMWLGKDNR
ncbi:hypothetical protein [Paraburkholderia dinghuensis]|uniref:Uncharacterized protein n=1 Tax=Paraburkholderia dinghuensis TaxID=2305225 RepID=A0A3N6PW92_9BURK|nr:hypothetical protein [Paraburkholderia dinghuensis]RQH06610.1 hypothetical protein D1Y85_12115 [Paraburkholderia dinghuensis]